MNGAIGNLSSIVESFYTADTLKSRASAEDDSSNSFQDYLNTALGYYRTGMLTGSGMYGNYSNILSGVAVNALLSRILEREAADSTSVMNDAAGSQRSEQKKPAWATIRVIRRYQEPALQPEPGKVDTVC